MTRPLQQDSPEQTKAERQKCFMKGLLRRQVKTTKHPLTSQHGKLIPCFLAATPLFFYETAILWKRIYCITAVFNGEVTRFGREGVNLVRALSNITEKAFNRIGDLDITSQC